MNQLIEGMLTIGSRFSPENRSGLIGYLSPIKRDMLAIAFHRQLLEISRETLQVLIIRKNCYRLCIEEVIVP